DALKLGRPAVIELLDTHHLLPAIFFIFSRAGCEAAVAQVMRSGVRLTTPEERAEIREIVDERLLAIPDEDLAVLGYWEWTEALQRGIAAHHAGMLPIFKEVVEELYQHRLLKVVFATETLALGINMPARTVVLEQLEKFNGESRVPITPGEYTQLTGRAGRRGIDVEGHSVVQWSDGLDPQSVAALASRRSYPLNSSFRPSYNMAVNLMHQFGRERTRELLESSFAQFQADRAVVTIAQKIRTNEESLAGYAQAMTCHLGDFSEYARLRRTLSDIERRPVGQSHRERDARAQELARVRADLKRHACHGCNDREAHARWAERWWRLRRDTDALQRQVRTRTGTVSRVFERILRLLVQLGYLDEQDRLSESGVQLGRIYGERDLLVSECVRRGVWEGIDAPSFAALAAALVYEPRREERRTADRTLPPGFFRTALHATEDVWVELDELEEELALPRTDGLATGLSTAMHLWARGSSLATVLSEADLAAGDFVRWTKQTIDLLDQIGGLGIPDLSATARNAVDSIRRGVIAY
ncbi:MAG TPA: helicase-related protein, partial [Microbacteriaceae bacterium]|nr:helicase-related protein [Microbacteriaceae bacterium]